MVSFRNALKNFKILLFQVDPFGQVDVGGGMDSKGVMYLYHRGKIDENFYKGTEVFNFYKSQLVKVLDHELTHFLNSVRSNFKQYRAKGGKKQFDVTSQESEVIGDRSFHSNPDVATELLAAYIDGMHSMGMVAIAKHFPGHGGVSGDSHHCLPQDDRGIDEIRQHDLIPYKTLVNDIEGVMTAHVAFSKCDPDIPTYSKYWIEAILRRELQFEGVVFSDDLSMQGAIDANDQNESSIVTSAQRAINAGCDMVLVCNRADLADELLDGLKFDVSEKLSGRLARLSSSKNY